MKFWIEDGILYSCYLQDDFILDASAAKKSVELRHEISKGEMQYWCYDFRNVKSMPKDGKDYANKYGQDFLHAAAAIVDNHIEKFIVNIFISLKNPTVPFKAFTSKEKAVHWLRGVKKTNENKQG